jgi:signal transduction histidine kinase
MSPLGRLTTQRVTRNGRASTSRLLPSPLPNGATLVVGRDVEDMHTLERVVWDALTVGGAVACGLALGGALLFRWQIERRIGTIRRTARAIEVGDLSRRVPITGREDEFARLSRDINRMLDRIEHLMGGVRDVSNAIAHDLRTPLGRLRGHLDKALRPGASQAQLRETLDGTLHAIDDLIVVFDTVLQIAEAESGSRRQGFAPVPLHPLITNVVDLYEAVAEAQGITLTAVSHGVPTTLGDKHLLAHAVANLLDNALKYAGSATTIDVQARQDRDTVALVVQDNGPGIPLEERARVLERFYRLDRGRSTPGHGLGLSIVAAITALHGGTLSLEDAAPGLVVRLVLPRVAAAPGAEAPAAGRCCTRGRGAGRGPGTEGAAGSRPQGGRRPGVGGTVSRRRGGVSRLPWSGTGEGGGERTSASPGSPRGRPRRAGPSGMPGGSQCVVAWP